MINIDSDLTLNERFKHKKTSNIFKCIAIGKKRIILQLEGANIIVKVNPYKFVKKFIRLYNYNELHSM